MTRFCAHFPSLTHIMINVSSKHQSFVSRLACLRPLTHLHSLSLSFDDYQLLEKANFMHNQTTLSAFESLTELSCSFRDSSPQPPQFSRMISQSELPTASLEAIRFGHLFPNVKFMELDFFSWYYCSRNKIDIKITQLPTASLREKCLQLKYFCVKTRMYTYKWKRESK